MPRVGGELGSVCSVVCIFFPWFRFRGLQQSNSSTSNSNSFALLRRRMARRTVLWAVALPRLGTLFVVLSVCSVVCIFFPWFRFRGLQQSNSSTSNSNSFALLRRRMARRTVLWAVALPRLETLVVVREGACGCLGGTCGSVLHVRVTQGGTRSGGACCETICAACSRCRRREGACRGSMDAPANAACGDRAGGEPLADVTVIVDWERVRSFVWPFRVVLALSGSPISGPGVALLPRPSFTHLLSHSGASVAAGQSR